MSSTGDLNDLGKQGGLPVMREVAAALMLLAVARTGAAIDSTPSGTPAQVSGGQKGIVRLEDQLVAGLRATRPDQRAFLRKIAEHVEKGAMDKVRVNAIFDWSRKVNPKYPFPYFERAMRFDAKKTGLDLPDVMLVVQPLGRTG